MRKFKLIKTYPGSPKLNTIVEVKHDGYIHWNVNSNENNPTNYIHNSAMEQYKEFWEELFDIEYKILTLKAKDNHINCPGEIKEIWRSDYNTDCWDIHSVKRLSDGEIFTIGDKTHLTNGNYYNFELKEFRFFNNGNSGHLEKYRNKTFLKAGIVSDLHKESTFFYLEDIVKTKIPLFKTEDEVDIFIGDDYWVYDYGALKGTPSEIHKVNRASQTHTGNGVDRKYFSTKENAEKYVLMNEPCLSVNDILRIGILKPSVERITFIEQVKYLVKDRLNGNK